MRQPSRLRLTDVTCSPADLPQVMTYLDAVEKNVTEHAARLSDESEKVMARIQAIADLLREADFYASQGQGSIVAVRMTPD